MNPRWSNHSLEVVISGLFYPTHAHTFGWLATKFHNDTVCSLSEVLLKAIDAITPISAFLVEDDYIEASSG